MERIRWIDHKGLQVLFVDFSNLLENKILRLIEEATEFQLKLNKKEILAIYDLRNTRTTPQVMQAGKNSVKKFAEHSLKRKVSMIGYNRMQRILGRIVLKDIYFAANLEEALNWIQKQAEKGHAFNHSKQEKVKQ